MKLSKREISIASWLRTLVDEASGAASDRAFQRRAQSAIRMLDKAIEATAHRKVS
jgi:hypothetical protein